MNMSGFRILIFTPSTRGYLHIDIWGLKLKIRTDFRLILKTVRSYFTSIQERREQNLKYITLIIYTAYTFQYISLIVNYLYQIFQNYSL